MKRLLYLFLFILLYQQAIAQYYPVPLKSRAENASFIVKAKVLNAESYIESKTGNIYTLDVSAWLKGWQENPRIGLIEAGGQVGDRLHVVNPSLELKEGDEAVFFSRKRQSFD